MVVPTPILYSTMPVGGVYSVDAITFWMKLDNTSAVNLFSGAIATGLSPSALVTYFAGAQLLL